MGKHGLYPTVGAKELVDLPAKFGVNLPSQRNVGNFGDGDDDGNNDSKGVDGYVGDAVGGGKCNIANFGNLDDGVEEKEGVEDARNESKLGRSVYRWRIDVRERDELQYVPSPYCIQSQCELEYAKCRSMITLQVWMVDGGWWGTHWAMAKMPR